MPLVRFRQQFVAVAADRGAHRAGFRARGLLALALPLVAHVALAHLRQALVPFVGRHLERAGLHAIAAAHALVGVVDHRSQGRLLQRAHRAHRRARRLLAVHAQAAAVALAVGFHRRQLVGRDRLFRGDLVVVRQPPALGAAAFAGLAADAKGAVVQYGLRHNKTLNSFLTENDAKCVGNLYKSAQKDLHREEELPGDFLPVGAGQCGQQVFRRPSAIRRHRTGQLRLPRIQALHRFAHPLAH